MVVSSAAMYATSTSTSLSIPPLTASSCRLHARFLVISEDEILHAAGNTLRISKFRSGGQDDSSSTSSRISSRLTNEEDGVIRDDGTHESTCTSDVQIDQDDAHSHLYAQQSIIFAEAERRRGFSCFCFNSYRRRVAYSPRRPSPSIFVKALGVSESQQQHHDILCEMEGGASIEYQDICFNRDGSRLAAIGKGHIDSVLYVWNIHTETSKKCGLVGPDDANANDDQCTEQIHVSSVSLLVSTLIATFRFDDPALTCLFDPCNDNNLSILCSDGTSTCEGVYVLKCNLKKAIGRQRKVVSEKILLDADGPNPNLVEKDRNHTQISVMAWESDSRLLLGTSNGSVFLVEEEEDSSIISKHPIFVSPSSKNTAFESVRTINITALHVIVGFETGKVLWLLRPSKGSEYELKSEVCEVDLKDDILQMYNTPDYRSIVVYTVGGKIYYLPIDGVQNHEEERHFYSTRFPTETVTALTSVVMTGKAGVPLLVTGDTNGRVSAWRELGSRETALDLDGLYGSIDLGSPITSMETLLGFPVCAVGFADSSIKFIHIARVKDKGAREKYNGSIDLDLVELKSEVLCSSPITHLCYNPSNNKLAAGCFHSGQIFVLCTEPSNLHVMGLVQIEKETLSLLRWNITEASAGILLAGSHYGCVSCFDTTPLCFTHEPLKPLWKHEVSPGSSVREIVHVVGDFSLLDTHKDDDSTSIICDSTEGIEIYEANISNERLDCIEKKSSVKTATGQITELLFNRKHIVFGSRYGSVDFIECTGAKKYEILQSLHLHCNAVVTMCLSSDGSEVYSSGLDGSIFVQRLCDPCTVQPSSYDYDYLLPRKTCKKRISSEGTLSSSEKVSWLDKTRTSILDAAEENHDGTRLEVKPSTEDTAIQDQNVFGQNQKVDEQDLQYPSEFALDGETDKINRKDFVSDLIKHRDEVISKMNDNDGETASLNERRARPMQYPFYRTFELSHNPKHNICSIPIRSLTEKELRAQKYMKYLRLNELSERRREKMKHPSSLKSEVGCEEEFIFNIDTLWKVCMPMAKEDSNYEVHDDSHRKDGVHNLQESLLYRPQDIRSDLQRRFQMTFAREVARDIAHNFNKKYESFRSAKTALREEIKTSVVELKRIAEELGATLDSNISNMCQVVEVDIDVTPDSFYNSRSEDNRGSSNEICTITKRSDVYKDTHGTEVETQGGERLAEDHHQLLTNELKKLSISIQEKITNFNESLKSLSKERMSANEKIQYIEMYRMVLAKSVFQSEIDSHSHQKLRKELSQLEEDHKKSKIRLEAAMAAYDDMNTHFKAKVNKDKAMNRRFRVRIQNEADHPLDQETLNLLCQLFQRRDINSQSNTDDDEYFISTRDPFHIVMDNKKRSLTPAVSSIAPKSTNIPEDSSIDKNVWVTLKALREEKIKMERGVAIDKIKMDEAQEYADNEASEVQNLSNSIARVREELNDLDQKMEERPKCPEFLISIKQGQNEMKNTSDDMIIADYSDAILIPSTIINEANDVLSKLIEDHLGILDKIEESENDLCKKKWEKEIQELRYQDAKELLKDYRLLKLTPQLKKMLNGETFDPAEIAKKLKDQSTQRKLVHDKNMKRLKREKKELEHKIRKRNEDNVRLREQLECLRKTVKSKEKESQSNKTSEAKADQKMKNIMHRSKCVEKIRMQSEEIKQLRSELDRLRQKTFPSFSPTVSRKLI